MIETQIVAPATQGIDQWKDGWNVRVDANTTERRALFEELARTFPRWSLLYPQGSLRDYLKWSRDGQFSGNLFTWYYAGLALKNDFRDEHLTTGDLSVIGRLIHEGHVPAVLRQVYLERGIEGVRSLAEKKPITTLQIPTEGSEEIRALVASVSESDNLPAAEAAGLILRAFSRTDSALQQAILHQERTGENVMDSLLKAIENRADYRNELANQGCVVCGYDGAGVQLHHVRLDADERYRTHAYLVPLCERHHIARPGDSTDSVHAKKLADLQQDARFWMNAFRAISNAAEAVRPAGG